MSGSEIYVRFGEVPSSGYSRNDETDSLEAGVSCYRATINDDQDIVNLIVPNDESATTAMSLWSDRPVYLVDGELLGIGGDGEPVLAVCSSTLLADVEVVNYSIAE